jgi:hypothetical protein
MICCCFLFYFVLYDNLTNNPDIPSDRAIMLREGANMYSLSNTTTTDSQQIEIAAVGNVIKHQISQQRE